MNKQSRDLSTFPLVVVVISRAKLNRKIEIKSSMKPKRNVDWNAWNFEHETKRSKLRYYTRPSRTDNELTQVQLGGLVVSWVQVKHPFLDCAEQQICKFTAARCSRGRKSERAEPTQIFFLSVLQTATTCCRGEFIVINKRASDDINDTTNPVRSAAIH